MEGFFLRWRIIKVYTFLEGREAQFFFAGNISDLKEKKRKKKSMNLYTLAPLRHPWKAQYLDLRNSLGHSIHSPVRTYISYLKRTG